jgi:hypothetical protein
MSRGIERGLSLSEWDNLTPGMIIGYIIQFNNDHLDKDEIEDNVRPANQVDFDRF